MSVLIQIAVIFVSAVILHRLVHFVISLSSSEGLNRLIGRMMMSYTRY